ncbi:hypothetical protein AT2G11215 [Arabidopsis thaliana]|uniref:Uncharacterized protein n=1 Tax=Arabidopsis thaliana TaxID=3702 RepID=A0A1P8B1J1_ARATH|nr:uncharacterized protein AT2G11215 [Arabidopsis thaliana]ANM62748.1 hypothetical protein AT2G11215 [Arabidopsis thaliana]|eukprot:NP_001324882.1 hypothetical protein AT2G11215 [Arabidopsis thaliana]
MNFLQSLGRELRCRRLSHGAPLDEAHHLVL